LSCFVWKKIMDLDRGSQTVCREIKKKYLN
jgi:hypothetical protein